MLLKPDFDLIAIWVGDVRKRQTRSELALTEHFATRALSLGNDKTNVFGLLQAEPEMVDSTLMAGVAGIPLERKYVEWAWALNLDFVSISVVLADAEDKGVELERSLGIL